MLAKANLIYIHKQCIQTGFHNFLYTLMMLMIRHMFEDLNLQFHFQGGQTYPFRWEGT